MSMRRCLLALILALSVLSARSADDPKRMAKYKSEMDRISKSLVVRPLELDKTVVRSGEVLKGSALLVNESQTDFVVPVALGTSGDSILGYEEWYFRKIDAGKKTEPSRRHGLIVRMPEIKSGQQVKLDFWAGEVDPKAENLQSGVYELTVVFADGNRKAVGSSSATFEVINPDYLEPAALLRIRKQEQDKLTAHAKAIYANLKLSEMSIGAATVKRGVVIQASSGLVNLSKVDIVLPDDPVFRMIGKQSVFNKRDAIIGMYQWTVERGGSSVIGAGGSVFLMPRDGVFPSGFEMPLRNAVDTKDLLPGSYDLVLTVRDCAQKVVGVRKQRFRVIN